MTFENIVYLIVIGTTGTLGQIFIYLTITKFDCFILTTVTTTRKFFSILVSIILFSHPMTPLHQLGFGFVISAVAWDVYESTKKQKKH